MEKKGPDSLKLVTHICETFDLFLSYKIEITTSVPHNCFEDKLLLFESVKL